MVLFLDFVNAEVEKADVILESHKGTVKNDANSTASTVTVHNLQASWTSSIDKLNLDCVSFTTSRVSVHL